MSDLHTAPPALPLVDFNDPVVVAQIEARAFQIASERAASAVQTVPAIAVERTSVAQHAPSPDEVTVVFIRFTLEGHTSYMQGQMAGFPSARANQLIASGRARLVHRHEQPIAAPRRVRA